MLSLIRRMTGGNRQSRVRFTKDGHYLDGRMVVPGTRIAVLDIADAWYAYEPKPDDPDLARVDSVSAKFGLPAFAVLGAVQKYQQNAEEFERERLASST